jgi:Sec-independent protein translocase protein TatA
MHLTVIAVVAVVLFGGKKLPELAQFRTETKYASLLG